MFAKNLVLIVHSLCVTQVNFRLKTVKPPVELITNKLLAVVRKNGGLSLSLSDESQGLVCKERSVMFNLVRRYMPQKSSKDQLHAPEMKFSSDWYR